MYVRRTYYTYGRMNIQVVGRTPKNGTKYGWVDGPIHSGLATRCLVTDL
jgi:hypothetical protein